MKVTVSVPYHGCPDTVRRAVNAVLTQTHTDLLCVVVNDGDHATPPWPALANITDPRLIRHDLADNHGRYHCDAVTLTMCDTPWWTIHDADDEADPRWLATMLETATRADADVVLTGQTVHHINGTTTIEPVLPLTDGAYRHHAHMAGLWSTSFLRSIGGPHPAYRVGWDTMLTGAALALGAATVLPEPLYTRHRRYGSLTTARTTGMRSPLRRRTVQELRRLWPLMVDAAGHGPEHVRAVLSEGRDNTQVGATAWGLVWPRLIEEHGDLWSGWALDEHGARTLCGHLADRMPRTVVEAGSGSSTVLLAEYARLTGATVTSLEHQLRFLEATTELIAEHGLADYVDVRHAPLRQTPTGPWYTTDLPAGIDFALVDGPPEATGGRAAALPCLLPYLSGNATLLLDDAHRPGEKDALAQWEQLGATVDVLSGAGKPMALVAPPAPTPALPEHVDASDVVLTLLTGDRPALLTDTLTALRGTAPGLLESAYVVVLHNGGDPATRRVLDAHADVIDERLVHEGQPLTCGEATSRLAATASTTGRPLWLHLEDDWTAQAGPPGWLDTARQILTHHPEVFQVRLRHTSDRVLTRHMVTRQPIRWTDHPGYRFAPTAHLTFNPTLMRTSDAANVWPAEGERAAQNHAHTAGLCAVAQLVPGVFTHAGANASLRELTGSPV